MKLEKLREALKTVRECVVLMLFLMLVIVLYRPAASILGLYSLIWFRVYPGRAIEAVLFLLACYLVTKIAERLVAIALEIRGE